MRLQGSDERDLALARIALRQLCTNAVVRCQALRELVADSLRSGEAQNALAFSKELLQQTNALFSDRLLRLDVLRATLSRDFHDAVASAQEEAARDPRKLLRLCELGGASGRPGDRAGLVAKPADGHANQPARRAAGRRLPGHAQAMAPVGSLNRTTAVG